MHAHGLAGQCGFVQQRVNELRAASNVAVLAQQRDIDKLDLVRRAGNIQPAELARCTV